MNLEKKLYSENVSQDDRLGESITVARIFEEATQIESVSGLAEDSTPVPEAWTAINRKIYHRLPKVALNNSKTIKSSQKSLGEILPERYSCRRFSLKPICLEDLASILDSVARTGGDTLQQRVYPSAGMRWPIEWYIAAINVSGLESGVYHYNSFNHSLDVLALENPWNSLQDAFQMQDITCPSAIIILTSIFPRTWIKYGARGSRFAHMEAGAAAMCFDLAATEIELGVVWIGGFIDRIVADALDLNWDMELEMPTLCLAVGYPS
ncbi:MAG: SagB/ThcOx family dehydrogenase [Okeania sp. SIO2C9]|uniref:SagB/ThcOx family dehydrogenase n=1 Tax=Okeania sp. SIO2C9 TaxID=2607791 RepID=UPI0013C14261|nr:SagB/ThcOx family dehydrogenase [Okeania sp. SIO2C9]NEQ73669.1 SagB/ThcOx family dehydrogenase [Okeania sp. SIO2C9]